MDKDLSTLTFCPSRKFAEEAAIRAKRNAGEHGIDPDTIAPYRSGYEAELRREIEDGLRAGRYKAVFSTNALEIVVDIGRLDVCILAGFPDSVLSVWQRIGRVGRSWDKKAYVLFYAFNNPFDRFFASNIDAFLDKPLDEILIGGGSGTTYRLVYKGKEVGDISDVHLFREAYVGAVYNHLGRPYRVTAHAGGEVQLEDVEPHLRTEGIFWTVTQGAEILSGIRYAENLAACYGKLTVFENFGGFKLIDTRSGEVVDKQRIQFARLFLDIASSSTRERFDAETHALVPLP